MKTKNRIRLPAELFVGNRTALRPVAAHDLPVLEAWDGDPVIIALMGRKYADRNPQEWFDSLGHDRSCRAFVIETPEGRLIGELELANLNWREGSAEIRICIGEKDCWNRGYGSDALASALRVAFEGYGLRTVYLRVFDTNTRAVHVYERIGFRKTAILRPCARRNDPAPVILMKLTRDRWGLAQPKGA